MNNDEVTLANVPIECPCCGQLSDSVKCYSLPEYLVFIGIYLAYSFKKEICCPRCMRKKILLRYFTYNIPLGNVLWAIVGLPMGLWKLYSSYTKGHSDTVQKILAEHIAEQRASEYGNVK